MGKITRQLHLPFKDIVGNNFVTRRTLYFVLLTTFIIFLPSGIAFSTNLVFSGGISSSEDVIRAESVDISKDGELIAIGYRNFASVIYQSNHTTHSIVEVNAPILDIEFSDDNERVAFSVNNSGNSSIGLYIWDYKSSEMDLINTFNVSENPRTITWFNNSQYVIVADGGNGAKVMESTALDDRYTLTGAHNSPVTTICANSDYIITADDMGAVRFWDDSFTATDYFFDLEQGVIDCEFNPQTEKIGILTTTGELKILGKDGYEFGSYQLNSANNFDWSENGENLRITANGQNEKRILELKASDFSIISNTSTFSNMRDYVIIENEIGEISQIFIATDSQDIGHWSVPMPDMNYGLPGADFDGDGIPDTFDDDDDGDGIIDLWDFNCPAQDETCAKNPNEDTIRNVQVYFNQTEVVLIESLTIDSKLSSDIRNISRKAVTSDKIIHPVEFDLFQTSICSNLDIQGYTDTWLEMMELSNTQLVSNGVECSVSEGLRLIAVDDYQTRIIVNFKSSYNYTSDPEFPTKFVIAGHPPAEDGSIMHELAIAPMSINIDGDLVERDSLSPFWKVDEIAEFQLNAKIMEERTLLEKVVNSFVEYPILLLFPMAILVILAIISLRRYNQSSLDLDAIFDEEEIEEENMLDSNIEDFDEDLEDYDIEDELDITADERENEIAEIESDTIPPVQNRKRVVRKKESTKSVSSSGSESKEAPVRTSRKKVSSNLSKNNDGPITKTKKRTLKSNANSTGNANQPKIKTRAVKTENLDSKPKTRRVRKVSKQADEMDIALEKITSKLSKEE
ncbi:MAG: WD40 repeat domain-containing protein [Candidatus Poseidoniaceae archaeon]